MLSQTDEACWGVPPLSEQPTLLSHPPTPGQHSLIETRGPFIFAPLVTDTMHLMAELRILFLRAAPPGRLCAGGDIDNRIKTLLDALRMPTLAEVNSVGLSPQVDEQPFFCLLKDDTDVTALTVDTDRFLDASNYTECLLVISAELHTARTRWENLGLT